MRIEFLINKIGSGFMKEFKGEQIIKQLESRKGGYFYLKIDAEVVNQFEKKRKTRLICNLDNNLDFRCGLNHLGDGNFFIILSKKNLQTIGKELGSSISYRLTEDPNPLGVDIPEILEVLLAQDNILKGTFDKLTDGKKRNVIHQVNRIKDIDKQVSKAIDLINTAHLPRKKKMV